MHNDCRSKWCRAREAPTRLSTSTSLNTLLFSRPSLPATRTPPTREHYPPPRWRWWLEPRCETRKSHVIFSGTPPWVQRASLPCPESNLDDAPGLGPTRLLQPALYLSRLLISSPHHPLLYCKFRVPQLLDWSLPARITISLSTTTVSTAPFPHARAKINRAAPPA